MQPLATLVFTVAGGVLSLILSEKSRLPSILFLLVFGVLLGPEFANLIQPSIFRENFPEYIALMVALILFEGGASLHFRQFGDISGVLKNLLTIGVLVTLVGASLAAHWVSRLPWVESILFGSVMIVTGPTVVIPILQRIRIKENLHNILKWEAILVDPLGVVIAVVLFEFLLTEHIGVASGLFLFAARILLGIIMGLIAGRVIVLGLSKTWLLRLEGEELGGLFLLTVNLLFFGICEFILTHSGLVAATVAGIYVGNQKFTFQEQIFRFKNQITLFVLSVLFILLSSNIPVSATRQIAVEGAWLVVLILFVARPVAVFLSTLGESKLSWQEKCFLGVMAPRGIVSASLASLFAIAFEQRMMPGRSTFLPLAFFVIAGTIVVDAAISALLVRVLNIKEGKPNGIVILGANPLGFFLGEALTKFEKKVTFIDSSYSGCDKARKKGFAAFHGSGFDVDFLESLDMKGVGKMIAATSNHEANLLSCQAFARFLGKQSVFRLWDKTDSWQSVTSATYDLSRGKPFLVGDPEKFDLDQLRNKKQYQVLTKKSEIEQRVTLDLMAGGDADLILFAVIDGDIQLMVPNENLKSNADLVCLKAE